MQEIGMIVLMYPRASPKIMLGAAPILQASARFLTGEYLLEVNISVQIPMISPDQSPDMTQPKAFHWVHSAAYLPRPMVKD